MGDDSKPPESHPRPVPRLLRILRWLRGLVFETPELANESTHLTDESADQPNTSKKKSSGRQKKSSGRHALKESDRFGALF